MSWSDDQEQKAFIMKKLGEMKKREAVPSERAAESQIRPQGASQTASEESADKMITTKTAERSLTRDVENCVVGVPSESGPATDSPSAPSAVTNAFKNDGSFLEQFKKMQKLNFKLNKATNQQIAPTEAQQRLVEESAGDIVATDDGLSQERQHAIERLAITVVVNGKNAETVAAQGSDMSFLATRCGPEFDFYNERVLALSAAKERAEQSGALPMAREEVDREIKRKKRKSRWGDWSEEQTRDTSLLAYAQQVYGSTTLSNEQWKQLEDQRKMRAIFELMQAKKAQQEALNAAGKVKYEYDSDEEVEGGTWEHRRRALEMEKTRQEADKLTQNAHGKHHLGDFLPSEELDKFMERYERLRNGQCVNFSMYEENKLKEDNVGFKMLQKMGWSEGQGLGAGGSGITVPVANQGNQEQRGLGAQKVGDLSSTDDEYEAYRKRMMLAYRFRPNPLNNPRRSYY